MVGGCLPARFRLVAASAAARRVHGDAQVDREKAASGSAGGGEGDARLCCFALWSPEGKLVAGEFESSCGVYTSFTDLHEVDGAGAIQMALTAKLLEKAGFAFWDMGRSMRHKSTQGAVTCSGAPSLRPSGSGAQQGRTPSAR